MREKQRERAWNEREKRGIEASHENVDRGGRRIRSKRVREEIKRVRRCQVAPFKLSQTHLAVAK